MSRCDVLLLGAAGFIGSALARRLGQEKTSVHVIGRHDTERLENVLPQCGTVIHLASTRTPGSSAHDPGLELGNLGLTLRLLALMRAQPETHLIFFSSGGTVYGNPDRLRVTEDAPIAPLSNDGAGKAWQEVFCHAFRAQGHAVTILRPSNAYGPGQTIKSGFGVVRTMLEHLRMGTALEVWGDGENVRDSIYINDLAEACARFVALPEDSNTYNLVSGNGDSVNQIRRIVEKLTGATLRTTHRPVRGTDVRAIVPDTTRLESRLLWKPGTSFEDGVKHTWEWVLPQP